jgi:hypothetical protein
MKFSSKDAGVVIPGATLFNPTEQSLQIISFAARQGFDIDENELTHLFLDLEAGTYDAYDEVDYVLEDALAYLNTKCVEDGCVFTFVDTDFVLVGADE